MFNDIAAPKYNHMLDVGFTIPNCEHEDWADVPPEVIIAALQRRVDHLRANPNECAEAFGYCDTYKE